MYLTFYSFTLKSFAISNFNNFSSSTKKILNTFPPIPRIFDKKGSTAVYFLLSNWYLYILNTNFEIVSQSSNFFQKFFLLICKKYSKYFPSSSSRKISALCYGEHIQPLHNSNFFFFKKKEKPGFSNSTKPASSCSPFCSSTCGKRFSAERLIPTIYITPLPHQRVSTCCIDILTFLQFAFVLFLTLASEEYHEEPSICCYTPTRVRYICSSNTLFSLHPICRKLRYLGGPPPPNPINPI